MNNNEAKSKKNKNLKNKYKNINEEDHDVKDILKDYKGPIPAYMPPFKKEVSAEKSPTSVIENNIFSDFSSQNEHTEILEESYLADEKDSDNIFVNIKNKLNLDENQFGDVNSKNGDDFSTHTKSFNNIKHPKKEEASISEQYEKFIKDDFGDENGTIEGEEDDFYSDESYYDEFYQDYGEKIGFFEKLRLKREEKKAKKEEIHNDQQIENRNYNDEYYEDYVEPKELESDYLNPTETRDKIYWLDHMVTTRTRQIVVLSVLSILALILTLPAYTTLKPIVRFVDIGDNPRIFAIINLVLIVLGIIVNFTNVRRGLEGFFTLNANGNSMMAIFSVLSAAYTGFLIYKTELLSNQLIHTYTLIACISLLINSIGHLVEVLRIRTNFSIISSQKEKTAVEIVADSELDNDMIKLLGDGDPQVVVPVKTNFLKRFFELSFDDYYGDSVDRVLAPVSFVLSLVLGLGTFFFLDNIGAGITVFFSSLAISAPLTSLLCTNLSLYKASKNLSLKGAVISGNEAIWNFSQTTALSVDANLLFPKNSVILQGIKTFEGGRIDQAILDATSVLNEINSPLSKTFLEIIENRTELLSKVDSIMYEDEMGISAWVNDRRILVGNRELMINHGVDVPDKSYENRYTEGSRDVVYLATSGVLTAMYVVKYMADTSISDALYDLNDNYVSLVVRTNDPNITALKLSEVFGLNLENIRVVPERRSGPYERVTRQTVRVDAKIAFIDDILGYFSAVIASVKLAPTISTSFLIQTIGIILGFVIIVIATFFAAIVKITPFTLIAYNLFWLFVILIINLTRRI